MKELKILTIQVLAFCARVRVAYQAVKVFPRQLYQKYIISSQIELFILLRPLLGAMQNRDRASVAIAEIEGAGR